MTDDPTTPTTPEPPEASPRAPGNRVSPGRVIAMSVAALMALGIAGLVAAALLGDDDGDPTGAGLRPTVNVDEPATAPPATGGTEPEPADSQDPAPTSQASPEDTADPDDERGTSDRRAGQRRRQLHG